MTYYTEAEQEILRQQLKEGHAQAAKIAKNRGYALDPRIAASRDDLGDRMKAYEATEATRKLVANQPVYIRLDGRAFSTFTRGLPRPYDRKLSWIMAEVTKTIMRKLRVDIAYTQSDEISLGWFAKDNMSEFLFSGRIQKLASVLAGLASARFNQLCLMMGGVYAEKAFAHCPHFDARIYQVPSNMELMNSFLWREADCRRNSVSMAAQAKFSHKELQRKDTETMRQMLFSIGEPYENLPEFFRKGSYFKRITVEVPIPDEVPLEHRDPSGVMLRGRILRVKNHPWQTTAERLQYFE